MNTIGFRSIGSYGRGALTAGQPRGPKALRQAAKSIVESLESRCLLSAVMGTVYLDSNDNGAMDDGEPGIGDTAITLRNVSTGAEQTATTDWDGTFGFYGVSAGQYVLSETHPADYLPAKGAQAIRTLNITDTDNSVGNDFGEIIPSSVAGNVFIDANMNGMFDTGEAGQPNVSITLTGNDDTGAAVSQAMTTDAQGAYIFRMLRPGIYTITEAIPNGYASSMATSPPTTANPVDILAVWVGSGTDAADNNFGLVALPPPPPPVTATLGGHVFTDIAGDGLTADDTAMAGVKVWLFADKNKNGILDKGDGAAVASKLSDAAGSFSFTDVAAGRYFMKESTPCGFVRTAPAVKEYYTVDAATGGSMGNLDFANARLADRSGLTNVRYVINGKKTVCQLHGQVKPGDYVQVNFTVRPGHTVTLSLVSYTAPSSHFVAVEASQQQIFQSQTKTFSPGTYKLALGVYAPQGNFQIDFVFGGVIKQLGPAKSNIFYSPQHRLISSDNGGPALKLTAMKRFF